MWSPSPCQGLTRHVSNLGNQIRVEGCQCPLEKGSQASKKETHGPFSALSHLLGPDVMAGNEVVPYNSEDRGDTLKMAEF